VAAILAAFGANAPSSAQDAVTTLNDGQLSICLYPGFPPIASRDLDGQWQGLDVVFLRDFAESLDLVFQPVLIEQFEGIWMLPGEDACDIAGSGITVTEPRQQDSVGTVWTDTYYGTFRAFAVRVGDQGLLQNVSDLANRTVIVTEGSTADLDLQRRIAVDDVSDVTIEYNADDVTAIQQVLDREAFAYGAGQVTLDYLVSNHPGLVTTWPHPYLKADGTTGHEEFSFVVRAADNGLLDALNNYIEANAAQYARGNG